MTEKNIMAARICTLLLLLFVSNLSAQSLVKDVATGTVNNNSDPAQFTTMGGVTYFVATTLEHGTELWRSDGTAGGPPW